MLTLINFHNDRKHGAPRPTLLKDEYIIYICHLNDRNTAAEEVESFNQWHTTTAGLLSLTSKRHVSDEMLTQLISSPRELPVGGCSRLSIMLPRLCPALAGGGQK